MNYHDLVHHLDTYLRIPEIADYGPQGLQVEADKPDVRRVALAVDTAPATIAAAAAWQADMLLVHHGILWGQLERIAGAFGARVRGLLAHRVHLYAAHLALDAHPEVGNNAVLAKLLGAAVDGWWCEVKGTPLGVLCSMDMPLDMLVKRVDAALDTRARVLSHGRDRVARLAIVSGFGADRVAEAAAQGADALLTGETSHANYWAASDYGLNVIFAGHYATETVGVQALGEELQRQFGLETRFFDFPTHM